MEETVETIQWQNKMIQLVMDNVFKYDILMDGVFIGQFRSQLAKQNKLLNNSTSNTSYFLPNITILLIIIRPSLDKILCYLAPQSISVVTCLQLSQQSQ